MKGCGFCVCLFMWKVPADHQMVRKPNQELSLDQPTQSVAPKEKSERYGA